MRHAVTRHPTPVFNTPDIATCFGGVDGDSLPLDEKNLMRSAETVLFPQSHVELLEQIDHTRIWRIKTPEYPYDGSYYIDERFLLQTQAAQYRKAAIPTRETILKQLKEMQPCRYMWGGNWPMGIDLLSQLYPSRTPLLQLDPLIQDTWKLKGLDCSGLPHYLTNGFTPRNTSALISYGKPIAIEGKNANDIIACLQSLDFIVWKGHVVWVIDQQWSIESKYPEGLVKFKLFDRLSEIMKERKPLNEWSDGPHFVARRWYPDLQF